MLSKEDYKKYLEQMLELEKSAIKVYSEGVSIFGDLEIKNTCQRIREDEVRHVMIVRRMIELLV